MSGRCSFPEDHRLFAGFLPAMREKITRAAEMARITGAAGSGTAAQSTGGRADGKARVSLNLDPDVPVEALRDDEYVTAAGQDGARYLIWKSSKYRLPDASAEAAAMQSRAGLGQSRALMFVGLATLIAGAVIGGDAGTIIMVAGAGIGLWGLYQYLQ